MRSPLGAVGQKLAELDAGGTFTFLHLYIGSSYVNARVANADVTGVAANAGAASGRSVLSPYRYTCLQGHFAVLGAEPPAGPPPVMPLPPGLFAADPGQLRLVGPDLRAMQLVRDPYNAASLRAKSDLPEDFFIPGEWTLRSTGGRDVASFEAPFQIAPLPPLDFPASIDASADYYFSWNPSSYGPADILQINVREANPGQTEGAGVFCSVPASQGGLTISSGILGSLGAESASELLWQMTLYASSPAFTAPGLEHGQITTSLSVAQEATVVE